MRAAALLIGLCLAWPAFGAPKGESACTAMLMPPEQLHEISRGFGHGHTGIDLMAPYGSPIRAAAGGTVVYAGWYFAYGKIVDIRHADGLVTRVRPHVGVRAGHRAGYAGGGRSDDWAYRHDGAGSWGSRALRSADRWPTGRPAAFPGFGGVQPIGAGTGRGGSRAGGAAGQVGRRRPSSAAPPSPRRPPLPDPPPLRGRGSPLLGGLRQ